MVLECFDDQFEVEDATKLKKLIMSTLEDQRNKAQEVCVHREFPIS